MSSAPAAADDVAALLPRRGGLYRYPVGLLLWIGAAVMVLGLVALIWPSRPDSSIVHQPRGSLDEVEVLPQPR